MRSGEMLYSVEAGRAWWRCEALVNCVLQLKMALRTSPEAGSGGLEQKCSHL